MKVPVFVRGTTDKIDAAILNKVIKYPAYIYNVDTAQFGFLDQDEALHYIVGNNPKYIEAVEALPEAASATTEKLYIFGNTVYFWDGEKYIPTYQALISDIETLQTGLNQLSSDIDSINSSVSSLRTDLNLINYNLNAVKTSVDQMAISISEISANMEEKADKATTLEGYGITDAYTKNDIDTLMGEIAIEGNSVSEYVDNNIAEASQADREYVDNLLAFVDF